MAGSCPDSSLASTTLDLVSIPSSEAQIVIPANISQRRPVITMVYQPSKLTHSHSHSHSTNLTPGLSRNKLPYYEDLYGKRNPDEDVEDSPDICEDESESHDLVHGKTEKFVEGFFPEFTKPKTLKRWKNWKESWKLSGGEGELSGSRSELELGDLSFTWTQAKRIVEC